MSDECPLVFSAAMPVLEANSKSDARFDVHSRVLFPPAWEEMYPRLRMLLLGGWIQDLETMRSRAAKAAIALDEEYELSERLKAEAMAAETVHSGLIRRKRKKKPKVKPEPKRNGG